MSGAIDGAYGVFMRNLETRTPVEAIKELTILGVPDDMIEAIRARFDAEVLEVKELDEPHVVVDHGRETWYTGPQKADKYWPAVEKILRRQGWEDDGIESLDESSTRIVSLLNHPQEKTFRSRGLVVGYVQSGKTTSFTSVIAKAADRGYKLVIVLSGIHNGLRRQTQRRLEQQLVEPNPTQWHQLTDSEHDFRPTANPASFFGTSSRIKVLCVVKKNGSVLTKLANWLEGASQFLVDTPTLIIDDEADQATVATKKINPLILRIMKSLPRSVYIGYTATPFANLLIDPSAQDLYPRDFVANLPKPRGHFGTEVIFGRDSVDGEDPEDVSDGYDMIRQVPQDDVELVRPLKRADIDTFSPAMVGSLRDAVEHFLLTTAARRVRGTGNPHNTMLIHTSVNTAVHLSYRRPLLDLLDRISGGLKDPECLDRLRTAWDGETKRVPAEAFGETKVDFDALVVELPGVIRDCRVVMDNSSSEDRLDYENGPVVAIAVGGNTLSRGLTLEGLSVSYFVRAVSAYDTLLQMGRWFGFRNGYADLPRIWMTDELKNWFRHIAVVEHEMRRDIDRYMTENLTPLQFGVRLRTHPSLLVTARAKMQSAVRASASYGGQRLQTHYFHTNAEWLGRNIEAARNLVSAARSQAVEHTNDGPRHVFRDVPYTTVLGFLTEYSFHEDWDVATSEMLTEYIQKRVRNAGSLRSWSIAVIGNPVDNANAFSFSDEVTVGRVIRSRLEDSRNDYADIKTLMSRRDAAVDLRGKFAGVSEKDLMRAREEQAGRSGLLVLYAIDKDSEPATDKAKEFRVGLGADDHVIGVGLVFPEAVGPDAEAHGYIQADLSGIVIEEEDFSAVDGEDE
ncbi:Z1 domain-containing protein [Promicromonospora soli]|uniref:Endonuclease n=1 Tax=Promicromonospora soli TaxID=2035533 RepID=A0A919KT44_9MICO|nr:Z1 domain-containing protein [Promicromonospora soli]GHH71036.1 endonuclease [Promicromonospora soli]